MNIGKAPKVRGWPPEEPTRPSEGWELSVPVPDLQKESLGVESAASGQ